MCTFDSFAQISKNFVISSYIENIETIFQLESTPCVYLRDSFNRLLVEVLFRCFIYVFVSICCISCHFYWLMPLNAALWITVTHTFESNKPKLADCSKWVCTALRSCFCSLLTSNWKVSAGRFVYIFIKFPQTTQKFVISSYIENLETNIPIAKHTLRVFSWYFEGVVGKSCVSMLHLWVCLHFLHFVSFLTICAVAYCHAYN